MNDRPFNVIGVGGSGFGRPTGGPGGGAEARLGAVTTAQIRTPEATIMESVAPNSSVVRILARLLVCIALCPFDATKVPMRIQSQEQNKNESQPPSQLELGPASQEAFAHVNQQPGSVAAE